MPSPSYLSLWIHNSSSSWLEAHAFCLPICSLLFLQQTSPINPIVSAKPVSALSLCLPSKVTAWISVFQQLPGWHILSVSCSDVSQLSHSLLVFNDPAQLASLSVFLPSSLHPWPWHVNSSLNPLAPCPPFCPPKSQFISFWTAVFLSSPSFLPCSLHLLHHLHASLLFIIQLTHIPFPIPPSFQAKLQHYRDKISKIFLKE